MKLIIAGGRDLKVDDWFISKSLEKFGLFPSEIISGACGRPDDEVELKQFSNGIDGAGEQWAQKHELPVKRFPAKFKSLGRPAGPIRNREMAMYADALLLIWDGKSRGSKSMRSKMMKLKKPIYEIIITDGQNNQPKLLFRKAFCESLGNF